MIYFSDDYELSLFLPVIKFNLTNYQNGIFKGFLAVSEREEKMVASAHNNNIISFGNINCN